VAVGSAVPEDNVDADGGAPDIEECGGIELFDGAAVFMIVF
jgi:hypothetical protein